MSSCYPCEFKQKVINLVTLERKSITQVSLELGLSKGILYYWLNHQSPESMALRIGKPFTDRAQEIKWLRAQNEAMKKENIRLRAERDDAKEENWAANLVIEYFRTHNPPKA